MQEWAAVRVTGASPLQHQVTKFSEYGKQMATPPEYSAVSLLRGKFSIAAGANNVKPARKNIFGVDLIRVDIRYNDE